MLPKPVRERKWSKPPVRTVTINFDASWNDGKADIGFFGHDSNGFVVGGAVKFK